MRLCCACLGLLAVGMVGCRADRVTTTEPLVTSASDVWSGGTLVVISPSFVGVDSLPIVTIGAETLAVRRAGLESVQIQIPDTNGTLTVGVGTRNGGRTTVQLRVHGLATSGPGPGMDYGTIPYVWPGGGDSALGFDNARLVRLNYALGTTSPPLAPDTALRADCNTSPLPSATVPGLVTVHVSGPSWGDACGQILAVSTIATAAPPDSGPGGADLGQWTSPFPELHLSRGHWLVSSKNGPFWIATGTNPGTFTWDSLAPGSAPDSYVLSPAGDRVVPTWSYVPRGGVPVFDATVPGVAYTLTALQRTWGAAFTPGGDTLFVAGADSAIATQEVMLVVEAATGAVLARAPISGYYDLAGLAVAADPLGPWVYVAWLTGRPYVADTPVVDVYDRRTLARVASLRASGSLLSAVPGDPFEPAWAWAFVMSPIARRLYLVFGGGPYVFQYDLMP